MIVTELVGDDVAGTEAVGDEVAGAEVVGDEVAGAEVVRAEVVGGAVVVASGSQHSRCRIRSPALAIRQHPEKASKVSDARLPLASA